MKKEQELGTNPKKTVSIVGQIVVIRAMNDRSTGATRITLSLEEARKLANFLSEKLE